MNKLKFISFLLLSITFLYTAKAATISGHIVNTPVKKVYLAKVIYGIQDQGIKPEDLIKIDSAVLNADGTFKVSHTLKEPGLFYLSMGSNNIKLYLKNDYALEVNCDIKLWPTSISIIGEKGALENTIYLQMRLKHFNTNGMGDIMKYNGTTYPLYTDSVSKVMYADYNQMKANNKIDVVFDSMIHTEIDYTRNLMLLMFNIIKSYYTTGKGSYNSDNPHYFDFLKYIELNNDAKALSDAYTMFMLNYCHYNITQTIYKDKETPGFAGNDQLIWAKENLKGKIRDYVVCQILKLRIEQNDVTNIKAQIDDFKTYNIDKDYYHRVANAYAKLAQFAPGNPFPDFSLPDTTGKKHSLKELRGKIVYIDYWASWCGPCRMEMPHSRDLIEKYKNNPNVAFVFVSIDNDKNAWLGAMHKENLKGMHLQASGGWSDAICRKYGINSIPRYMLIDKEGNIVNIEAKRPSAGIDKEIDNLLK